MPLWLHWILLGLLAGALAKFLVPGRDPSGCIVTILLGIAGAFIGGWIGTQMGWGSVGAADLNLRSLGLATLGAIVLLLVGRVLFRRRRSDPDR
ncbi:MAG: GlsB/YeaQ/YmgE family stress response membrane protein [Gemmatimonadaceae bacterium]|nr:GlsB/YeaQ/YmgE family stress response membrane protein [Gemmatimonadaceae bacterium]MDQ3517668.1 GlsB/YeaQ/YmgE family stress response membrane protein [Gemmatimonadota bacterium]